MKNDSLAFAPAHLVSVMDEGVASAQAARAALQTADDVPHTGRYVSHDGVQVLNFVGCSYLGLELRPELKAAAIAAIERFGTQFSCSRAVLQSALYVELEQLLGEITGGHVVVAASTSLAHIAALPVLVEPNDAVVIDQQAHASLHTAVALLRSPVEVVRHNRLDLLDQRLSALGSKHRRVWYLLDGLYSMLGDHAPVQALTEFLQRHPALHLYVDDAHSTSWTGTHGRGHALEHLPDRSRVVGVLSLNKAFSAGGGALVLPSATDALRVRRCGGPIVFAGPLQPPLLGAALASARLHLSSELVALQARLGDRLRLAVERARELDVPLADETLSPIFFVRCGARDKAFELTRALRAKGIYTCPAFFPVVPKNHAGVRITISLHNEPEDIDALMNTLAVECRRLGVTRPKVVSAIRTLSPRGSELKKAQGEG